MLSARADETERPASAGCTLVVEVVGLAPVEYERLRLSVDVAGAYLNALGTGPFASEGRIEVPVSARELEAAGGMAVLVDHPLYAPAERWMDFADGIRTSAGGLRYELRMSLTKAAVLTGRVLRPSGAPASDALVACFALTDGMPHESEEGSAECDDDGRFRLRLTSQGEHVLVGVEAGLRPRNVELLVRGGTTSDLGDLHLEQGLTIDGYASRQGTALAGARIRLRAAESGLGRRFFTDRRGATLRFVGGAFEYDLLGTVTADDGGFAFHGLVEEAYDLHVERIEGARSSLAGDWPQTRVKAPRRGLELEFGWTTLAFELLFESEGAREAAHEAGLEGKLVLVSERDSADFLLRAEAEPYVVVAPPDTALVGELGFPGHAVHALDLVTPGAGGETRIPLRMVPGPPSATLVLDLEAEGVTPPEDFAIRLERLDADEDRPVRRIVTAAEGRLELAGLVPASYRVRVSPGGARLRAGLLLDEIFELELAAGDEEHRTLRLRRGAGLRLTVRDAGGDLVDARYRLHDTRGQRCDLDLAVRRTAGDWFYTPEVLPPYGTYETYRGLEPGVYELTIEASGYTPELVRLELTAGEVEELELTLTR